MENRERVKFTFEIMLKFLMREQKISGNMPKYNMCTRIPLTLTYSLSNSTIVWGMQKCCPSHIYLIISFIDGLDDDFLRSEYN